MANFIFMLLTMIYISTGFLFFAYRKIFTTKISFCMFVAPLTTINMMLITYWYQVEKNSLILSILIHLIFIINLCLSVIYKALLDSNYVNNFKEFLDYKTWIKKAEEDMENN